jgi:hypothetical protein
MFANKSRHFTSEAPHYAPLLAILSMVFKTDGTGRSQPIACLPENHFQRKIFYMIDTCLLKATKVAHLIFMLKIFSLVIVEENQFFVLARLFDFVH